MTSERIEPGADAAHRDDLAREGQGCRRMISDPHDPAFRYPQPGERYWHQPWNRWCVVLDRTLVDPSLLPHDEVVVQFDGGDRAIVKMKSLEAG